MQFYKLRRAAYRGHSCSHVPKGVSADLFVVVAVQEQQAGLITTHVGMLEWTASVASEGPKSLRIAAACSGVKLESEALRSKIPSMDTKPAIAAGSARKGESMMKNWTEQRIDRRSWKRVPGNPFADYDPKDGIALWSLWKMPSSSVGKLVRRGPGRPWSKPTSVRSIRLPVEIWPRAEP